MTKYQFITPTRLYQILATLFLAACVAVGLYLGVELITTQSTSNTNQNNNSHTTANSTNNSVLETRRALTSLADHLAFALGLSHTEGFPDPFNRHDKNKSNYRRTNGKHIKNALEGIERNLKPNETLRDFFRRKLNPPAFESLTTNLNKLIIELQNPTGDIYLDFGAKLSEEILAILTRTGYI